MRTILLATVAAVLLAAPAAAQVQLTTFQAGDPIVASEMNANFQELATNAEAVAPGRHLVTAADLVPRDASTDFIRGQGGKYYLELEGTSETDGPHCFLARVRLPDGATVTLVGATLQDPDPSGDVHAAEAGLLSIPFATDGAAAPDELAGVTAFTDTFFESKTTGGALPAVIDRQAATYVYVVCLEGFGSFLNGRIEYDLP